MTYQVVDLGGLTVSDATPVVAGPRGPQGTMTDAELDTILDEAVAVAVEGQAFGAEMAYAERTASFTTTSVTPSLVTTGLTAVVTGTGRPVDIEVYYPRAYHSVANGGVIGGIWAVKTGSAGAFIQLGEARTISTSVTGQVLHLRARKVLPLGEEWTFSGYLAAITAGTAALGLSALNPAFISVVSR